jgi:hypothetical protein
MFHDDPCAAAWDRPVFIITTGRSGSTLLLRYLNCAEGLVVWGEHAGVLRELAEAYRRLTGRETTEFVEAARPWVDDLKAKRAVLCPLDQMTIEWVNGFDPAAIRGAFRRMLLGLFTVGLLETTRWGFKEIHYGCREMNLLRQLFAEPRFIMLVRRPAAILKSKLSAFARGDRATMAPHVRETRAFFESAVAEARSGAPDVLFVHYEDLVSGPAREIERLAAFIGAPFAADAVRAIGGERANRDSPASSPRTAADDIGSDIADLGLTACAEDIAAIAALDKELGRQAPARAASLAA